MAFCIFIAAVFAFGGGSRGDIVSLVLLRPLAVGFAAYALILATGAELRRVKVPLILLGLLAALMTLQLVPLPVGLWTALPGRDLYVAIARDAGLPLESRPLTLSPSRTLNALLSLSVPLAAVLLIAIQDDDRRRTVFHVLLAAAGASALVALGQATRLGGAALYPYRITNAGFPVGLMANRNHQALLIATMLPVMAVVWRRMDARKTASAAISLAFGAAAMMVVTLILLSGSRASLAFLVVAAAAGVAVLLLGRGHDRSAGGKLRIPVAWLAGSAVALLALVAALLAFSRAETITRLFTNDALNDYRIQRLPTLLAMLREHWLFGIGYGAFEPVFLRYEPVEALTPFIFNQAHDDWLQFAMEGGLPGVLLLITAVGLAVARTAALLPRFRKGECRLELACATTLLLAAIASAVDYPLRTPVFMAVCGCAFTLLTFRRGQTAAPGAPG